MSKKQEFIDYVEENLMSINYESIPENVKVYWESLKKKEEKPLFTENGKKILTFLRDNSEVESWKARDIAEGLFMSPRSVSGSMRKLLTDGYCEKTGKDPVCYLLTEKGKTFSIDN